MCTDTRTYNSIKPGCKWAAGRGGFREMELLLWMGPHQRKQVETVLSSDLKWNTPFSWHRVSMPPPSYEGHSQHAQYHEEGESEPSFTGLQATAFPVKRVCHGSEVWTLSSWHGYLAVKYSVSKGPLLPSTHAVTTSAWPGDTPWVNKWGACQSAHHNSSETVVRREDLDMLGFGFFQLCCCLYRPAGSLCVGCVTLRYLDLVWRMTSALRGGCFLCCELICGASLSLIMLHLDRTMVLWFEIQNNEAHH